VQTRDRPRPSPRLTHNRERGCRRSTQNLEGHGFRRSTQNIEGARLQPCHKQPAPQEPTALPKAGVKPQAQRPNCLPPSPPYPNPSPPTQNLSSPRTPSKPPNPLYPLAIYISKTWHSYPHPLATIEIAPNSSDTRAGPNSFRRVSLPITPLVGIA
jgi:hypothetical protein